MRRTLIVIASALCASSLMAACAPSTSGQPAMPTSPSLVAVPALDAQTYRQLVTKSLGTVSNVHSTGTSVSVASEGGNPTTTEIDDFMVLEDGVTIESDILGVTVGGGTYHLILKDHSLYGNSDLVAEAVGLRTSKPWVLINDAYDARLPGIADVFREGSSDQIHPMVYLFAAATVDPDSLGLDRVGDDDVQHYRASIPIAKLIAMSEGLEQRQWVDQQTKGVELYQVDTWIDSRNLPVGLQFSWSDKSGDEKIVTGQG